MNEEALKYSWELFKRDGYNGTIDDYRNLISSNDEALNYSHQLFSKDGYNGDINAFKQLVGVKKKDQSSTGSNQTQPGSGSQNAQSSQDEYLRRAREAGWNSTAEYRKAGHRYRQNVSDDELAQILDDPLSEFTGGLTQAQQNKKALDILSQKPTLKFVEDEDLKAEIRKNPKAWTDKVINQNPSLKGQTIDGVLPGLMDEEPTLESESKQNLDKAKKLVDYTNSYDPEFDYYESSSFSPEDVKKDPKKYTETVLNDYLNYLKKKNGEDGQAYLDVKERFEYYKSLGDKLYNDESYADDLKRFQDLQKEALSKISNNAYAKSISIENSYDWNYFSKKASELEARSRIIEKQMDDLGANEGKVLSLSQQKKLEDLKNQYVNIQKEFESLSQDTNIDQSVIDNMRMLQGQIEGVRTSIESIDNAEGVNAESIRKYKQEQEANKKAQEQFYNTKADGNVEAFGKGVTLLGQQAAKTFVEGVFDVARIPEIAGEAFGAKGYGWSDKLSETADNINSMVELYNPQLDTGDFSNFMKFMNTGGQGLGSVAQFMAAGAGASRLSKGLQLSEKGLNVANKTAQFTAAASTSTAGLYNELIDAGFTPEEAARYSLGGGIVMGAAEMLISEDELIKNEIKRGFVSAVKSGATTKEAIENGLSHIVLRSGQIIEGTAKETAEEAVGSIAESSSKQVASTISGKKIDGIWNLDDFNADAIGGGGGTAFIIEMMKFGPRKGRNSNPFEENLVGYLADNYDKVADILAKTHPEDYDKIADRFKKLKDIHDGLKNTPAFNKLSKSDQDHILAQAHAKQVVLENIKQSGLDKATFADEIASIDEDIFQTLNGLRSKDTWVDKSKTQKENAVQEKKTLPLLKLSNDGKLQINQDLVSERSQIERGIQNEKETNYSDEETDRRMEATSSWLQTIEGGDREKAQNKTNELLGEYLQEQKEGRRISENNDGGRSEISTQGDNGKISEQKTGEVGTRTSQERGYNGQQDRKSSVIESSGAFETPYNAEAARGENKIFKINETKRESVVKKTRELFGMPFSKKSARISRDLQKMLYEASSNEEKNQIINQIKETLYESLSKPSSEKILPREQGATTETGGQPQGVGQSVQGQEITQEGQEVSQEGLTPEQQVSQDAGDVIAEVNPPSTLAASVYPVIGEIETAIENNLPVNEEQLTDAENKLYSLLDEIDSRQDLTPDQKQRMASVIENRITKLQNYDNRTRTETSTTTQAVAAGRVEKTQKPNERATIPVRTVAEEGIDVTYDGRPGRVELRDGQYVFVPKKLGAVQARPIVIGEAAQVNANSSFAGVENPTKGPNNSVANITLPNGSTLSILNDDLSIDIGLEIAKKEIGAAPQSLFDVVFDEVVSEQKKEVPVQKKEEAQVETTEQVEQPTQEAQQPVQEARPEQAAPYTGVTPADRSLKQKYKDDSRKRRVLDQAQRIANTLGLDVPIFIHETTDDYNSALSERGLEMSRDSSNGKFVYSEDGSVKEIHINLSEANERTLPHEAAHAILFKAFGDNQALFQEFKDRLAKILKESTVEELEAFANNPAYISQGVSAEEFSAELAGKMTAEGMRIPKTTLQKIAKLINEFVGKITKGKVKVFEDTAKTSDVIDFFNSMADAFAKGKTITNLTESKKSLKESSISSKSQVEKLFKEKTPVFKNLLDISNYIEAWVEDNKLFDDSIENVSDNIVVKKFSDHILKEIKAWNEIKGSEYIGFYDEDIPSRLNPELQKFAKERYGRELTDEEVSLYHIVSAFASPSADPEFDSSKGLEVFDKYMTSGILSGYSNEQATIWEMGPKGRYDTGKPKFDDQGNVVYKQIAKAYAVDSLEKFNKVLLKFDNDISKAINWVLSKHTYEEVSDMLDMPTKGPKAITENEYFDKQNGGMGVFGITGVKLGSYILNRVGDYSTVTKDMWYARTLARLAGESLSEKGKSLTSPWALTKAGLRKRKLADEAFAIAAKKLNTTPADIQQKMWDFEKRLYEKLGAVEKASYASDGFLKKAKELSGEKVKLKSKSQQNLVEKAGMSSRMTEDDQGNYLFYHFSPTKISSIDPKYFGRNVNRTGRDERPGLNISMYYTEPGVKDISGDYGYVVRIPKDQVYPFNKDPLDLYDKAKAEFNKKFPGQAFDPNKQVAFIAKEAAKLGYPMTVAKWANNKLRAQTTEKMQGEYYTKPEKGGGISVNPEIEQFEVNQKARRKDLKSKSQQETVLVNKYESLPGAPKSGPIKDLVDVAENYAKKFNVSYTRQAEYVEVDEDFARRIADAYEEMKHDPSNPKVKEAYSNLIQQTKDQYNALIEAGYKFSFFDSNTDPYDGNPMEAMRDLRNNKQMAVYGTYDGYGTEGITGASIEDNPMLENTGLQWVDQKGVMHDVTANDLFRAVHDAFGHGLEGAGFRARGEENAWQAHARLFTGSAVAAITSETRGQNSWLNFGPFGEKNRTAKLEDTVFAEQKTGLMPEWTWTENVAPAMPVKSKSQEAAIPKAKSQESSMVSEMNQAMNKTGLAKENAVKRFIEKYGQNGLVAKEIIDNFDKIQEQLGITKICNI